MAASMARPTTVLVCLVLACCSLCVKLADAKLVIKDLSYTFDNTTIYWPNMQKERFRFVKEIGNVSPYYAANTFSAAEHGGTHIDAPSHFAAGKHSVEEIPLTTLVGKAVLVNVVSKANANKDLLIGRTEFDEHEKQHGRIPDGSIVLLYSGKQHRHIVCV